MLSRFSRRALDVKKCWSGKYQQIYSVTTSGSEKSNGPAQSGQRDLVNFPDRVRPEYPPPSRFLFIPESWFQYFYPKTGVTGPYMFAIGVGTTLFSKEYVVLHGMPHVKAVAALICVIYYKFGDAIGKFHNKLFEEACKSFDEPQEFEKKYIREEIEHVKNSVLDESVIEDVLNVKRENVYFQMEAAYRKRLTEVYNKIKKQLDFQVELENVERRIAQRNLSDYVIRNVMSSITPEQEKLVMQLCIKNLNNLAATKS